jgi:hypothetical protein
MGFSVRKAVVYGIAMFAGLLGGIMLGGGVPLGIALIGAAAGAVLSALVTGYLMRDGALEVAAATPASVDAAVRGAWALRSFRRSVAEDGVVTYARGAGIFADTMSVTPTATGVMLRGPSNILAIVKRKAAG